MSLANASRDANRSLGWPLPSPRRLGKYSPRIAPADAMVIDFGVKNQVVAL
jgi:hypothetical protein